MQFKGKFDPYIFGYVKQDPTAPAGSIECGEFILKGVNDVPLKKRFEQCVVFDQKFVETSEEYALLFEFGVVFFREGPAVDCDCIASEFNAGGKQSWRELFRVGDVS